MMTLTLITWLRQCRPLFHTMKHLLFKCEVGGWRVEIKCLLLFYFQGKKDLPYSAYNLHFISFIWKLQHADSVAHNRALNHMRFYLFICYLYALFEVPGKTAQCLLWHSYYTSPFPQLIWLLCLSFLSIKHLLNSVAGDHWQTFVRLTDS